MPTPASTPDYRLCPCGWHSVDACRCNGRTFPEAARLTTMPVEPAEHVVILPRVLPDLQAWAEQAMRAQNGQATYWWLPDGRVLRERPADRFLAYFAMPILGALVESAA